ncbi:hypothetical protein ACNR9Q_02975 [Maribacter sp. X9]|uniref:hypothetical protein n=1 Tax=Maribacter sp. X9 TaxID=3402159 RepID=UPI003AF3E100
MVDIIELIAGVSIVIALGFIVIYVKDSLIGSSEDSKDELEEEAFCEIDIEYLWMNAQKAGTGVNDINDLKRKIQTFKNRNRFYKM